MNSNKGTKKLAIFGIILAILFVSLVTATAIKTFRDKKAAEQFTEIDYYSMQEYCDKNAQAVFKALKSGKAEKLAKVLTAASSTEGVEAVIVYTDWKKADFENAIGIGAGSLSAKPDANGRIDVSERYFVSVGNAKYVVFVESVTSRWGRNNEGVSSVAVTTYDHFDNLGYAWNGRDDEHSVHAGTLFWVENQPAGVDREY